MKHFELPFGKITLIDKSLVEVIINEDVEMDLEKATELHGFLADILENPYYLLINKKNKYRYSYTGQKELLALKKVGAMAIISYSTKDTVMINSLKKIKSDRKWDLELFSDKKTALEWLEKQRNENESS